MRKFAWLSMFFVFFAAAPALAQGTPQQQEACKNDAFRFCEAAVPDTIAVEACLRANMRHLSPACRHEFGEGPAPRRHKR